MAGKWEGFTEDDINFYMSEQSENTENGFKHKSAVMGKQRRTAREKSNVSSASDQLASDLPESAFLLKSQIPVESETTVASKNEVASVPSEPIVLITNSPVRTLLEKTVSESVPVLPDTLETFQHKQKLLEEQNRQRKQFLAKILSDRKKQTTEEARRLQSIQEELHKLDIQLSNDVGILRNEIEVAAMEFGEAQKRYNRAEKEFLDAKQNVFAKLDRKELLTKHLCTIIEQNEVRKAQKLSELMEKLSIEHSMVGSSITDKDSNENAVANASSDNPSFIISDEKERVPS